MKKAIFFDWDGTLSADGITVSPENRNALKRVQEKGHLTFLCTGRPLVNAPKEAFSLGFDGMVCGAGCHIYIGEKCIYQINVPDELLRKVYCHFEKDGQRCIFEGEKQIYLMNYPPEEFPHLHHIYSREEFEEQIIGSPITKFSMEKEISQNSIDFLSEHFDLLIHDNAFQEVLPKGNNKATGIQKVLDYYGMEQKDCVSVGDSVNDLAMLRYAGLSIAMGQAADSVKKEADIVVASVENHGVAEALNNYIDE